MSDNVVITQEAVQQVVTTTAQSVTATVESVKHIVVREIPAESSNTDSKDVQQITTFVTQPVAVTVDNVRQVVTAAVTGPRGVQGPQGEVGPQGPPGDSYIGGVLTVVDAAQINDLLAYNGTYWTNKRQTLVTDGGNF